MAVRLQRQVPVSEESAGVGEVLDAEKVHNTKKVKGPMGLRKADAVRVCSLLTVLLALAWLTAAGTAQEPPKELVFEAKLGNVTFHHAEHVERENGDCKVCHDKLFPQSRAPLNFKAGMHKPAEAKKESCAACHVDGGKAFASKGNCKTCHVK